MGEDRSFKDDAQKRILVVEDDEGLAQLLTSFFQKAEMDAQYATKGKAAIELFKEFRPHLVLLDLLLPDLMGFDVLKRMKEPPWADQVAFICMSGIMKDHATVAKVKMEHGADDFIEKPFRVREMHNKILHYLGLDEIKEEEAKPKADSTPTKSAKAPIIPEPEVTVEGGDLDQADLPRLLSAFFTAKVTGVLKVSSEDIVKAIYFENGLPIFAASKDERDRLGEIAFRSGLLNDEQITEGLEKCTEENRLGQTLIDLGYLDTHKLYELIQTQVKEIILSCFLWEKGRYAFNFEDLASREMIKLQTAPADLVIEGIRKFYSVERLDTLISARNRLLVKSENPAFRFQSLHLGSSDMRIFDLVNGKRTIQKVIEDSKRPEANVLQLLYGLLVMKILEDKK